MFLNDLGNYLEIISQSHTLFIYQNVVKSSMFIILEGSNMNANDIFRFVIFF